MANLSDLTRQWGEGEGVDQVAQNAGQGPVSLVLAVDVSASISDADYNIQREGTGIALRNISHELVAMAERGTPAVITYIEFSETAAIRIEPRLLRSAADVEQLAQEIERMERADLGKTTFTSDAMAVGTDVHRRVGEQYGHLSRKVTDISADGFGTQLSRNSVDPVNPEEVAEFARVLGQRDIALAEGIEINGIVMPSYSGDIGRALVAKDSMVLEMLRGDDHIDDAELERLIRERPELFTGAGSSVAVNEEYYRKNVVTGFTVRAPNAEAYGETLEMKLQRELLIGQDYVPENGGFVPGAAPRVSASPT